MRFKSTEHLGLEVTKHDTELVLLVGELDELLHARCYLPDFTASNVDLLVD